MAEGTGAKRKVLDGNSPGEEEGRHTERLASSRSRDTERKISFPEAGFSRSDEEKVDEEVKEVPVELHRPEPQEPNVIRDDEEVPPVMPGRPDGEIGPVAAAVRKREATLDSFFFLFALPSSTC